jgi:hypothetical protein
MRFRSVLRQWLRDSGRVGQCSIGKRRIVSPFHEVAEKIDLAIREFYRPSQETGHVVPDSDNVQYWPDGEPASDIIQEMQAPPLGKSWRLRAHALNPHMPLGSELIAGASVSARVCITCVVPGFCADRADRENRFVEEFRKSRMISNLVGVRIPLPPPVPLNN